MRKLFSFLLLLFCIAGCKKNTQSTDSNVAKTIMNLSYGAVAAQKMDIYLPSGRNSNTTKVMLLLHGGAWTEGDKSDFNPFIDMWKKRLPGYAFFNINYRLATTNSNQFPTQENDVKAAVEFIYNKRTAYQVSDQFVLLGFSAGAQLALLQAYKYSSPVKPKAVVSFFGPTDLTDLYNNPPDALVTSLLFEVTGTTPAENAALYQQSSPVNFVTASSCPTILLQGGQDLLVSPSQATLLQNKLQTFGVINQLVFYPNDGHGWAGDDLTDSFNKVEDFLNDNVK